jgi:hypothetical protein
MWVKSVNCFYRLIISIKSIFENKRPWNTLVSHAQYNEERKIKARNVWTANQIRYMYRDQTVLSVLLIQNLLRVI